MTWCVYVLMISVSVQDLQKKILLFLERRTDELLFVATLFCRQGTIFSKPFLSFGKILIVAHVELRTLKKKKHQWRLPSLRLKSSIRNWLT